MGMDADSVIWIGIVKNHQLEEVTSLPEDLSIALQLHGTVVCEGLIFQEFYDADTNAGFGVEVFHHCWRTGAVTLDLTELASRVQFLLPKAIKAFQAMGINCEPKVWLGTHLT